MLCEGAPPPTVNDCCTCAEAYVRLPNWLALTMHVPAPTTTTLAPLMVHTAALDGSAEKTTGSPELAVAHTTYGGSPRFADEGAVEVKAIVCGTRPTVSHCCACGAAR